MTENKKDRLKKQNKRHAKILGTNDYSTAHDRLHRMIILDLAEKLNKNICTCGKPVVLNDYHVGHRIPWRKCWSRPEGSKELYWSIDNIILQCSDCNKPDNLKNHRENHYTTTIDFYNNHNLSDTMKNQKNMEREVLGMCPSRARNILMRWIMFEWMKLLKIDKCVHCPYLVDKFKEFSIEHTTPWLSGKTNKEKREIFFDVSKILFSHRSCNSAAARGGKGKCKYIGVSYRKNPDGYWCYMVSFHHNGKTRNIKCTKDIILAAENYDMAVVKYRDGRGKLNFPEKMGQYLEAIKNGWDEKKPKAVCQLCGKKHWGKGYCRYHYYIYVRQPIERVKLGVKNPRGPNHCNRDFNSDR